MADSPLGFLDVITALDDAEREAIMRRGAAPGFDDLLGWEFDGVNTLGLTRWVGIRKFKKGFYDGPPRVTSGPEPFIQGYNVKVQQNGLDEPHHARPSEELPKRHDFYRVYPVVPGSTHSRYPNALLLDYGYGGGGASPGRFLRDYLVYVNEGDQDLLLGKAYLAPFGGAGFPLSYFVLRRNNRHDFHG